MARVLDLFAGVSGFSLGFTRAGYELVGAVEWDERCQQVLRRHHPGVPLWGDITKVHGADLPVADVIVWGSPCQDLSVAGSRTGLVDGDRSSMFFEGIRVIREMRDATAAAVGGPFPRWTVWENVAGALSSRPKGVDGARPGDDFRRVLQEHADLGPHLLEWRVLDARWVGGCELHGGPRRVPQRRRRVFVVAGFDPRAADGPPVLAVAKGGGGHPRAGDPKGQVTPRAAVGSVVHAGEHATALTTRAGNTQDDQQVGQVWVGSTSGEGVAPPLLGITRGGGPRTSDVDTQTFVVEPESGQGADMKVRPTDHAPSLTANAGQYVGDRGLRIIEAVAVKAGRAQSADAPESWVVDPDAPAPTLNVFDNNAETRATVLALTRTIVRRLTPTECERLMGWPDGWTASGVMENGMVVGMPDSTRYRMCGNGVAANVSEWIAHRLLRAGV